MDDLRLQDDMTKSMCSIDGCTKAAWARTWCNAHYQQWRIYGDPLGHAPEPPTACGFAGCDNPYDSRGYCASHARQLRQGEDLRPLRAYGREGCSIEGCPDPHQGLGYCNRHLLRVRNHDDAHHVRRPEDAHRKYELNRTFFDGITTEKQAYWLGFITADGGITQTSRTNTLRVGLHPRDEDHLVKMNADLGSDRPLLHYPAKPSVTAAFDSLHLVDALGRLGVGPRKSVTVKPWGGPDHLMPHYWRGMFDGDGSIFPTSAGQGWCLFICGSEFCVKAFASWAAEICGSTATPRHLKGGCWGWRVGGGPKPQLLARVLYGEAATSLARKQERANRLIATASQTSGRRPK
jgi:hypothetical protein